MKSRTISLFALYTALAFIFSYIESLIPIPMPVPGMKLGLSHIVLVIVLYQKGLPFALGVTTVRTVLTAFTFGNPFLFFFSIIGSVLSLAGMSLLIKRKYFHTIAVSAAGGVLHNIGQILVAIIILNGTAILSYLPILYFSGLISGIFIGFVTAACKKRLPGLSNQPKQKRSV